VLTETNLRSILTLDTFNTKLTAEERTALLALLPEVDRENVAQLFSSNPHFQQSIETYRDLLKVGMFDPQMRDYLAINLENQWKRKDPWKVRFIPPPWKNLSSFPFFFSFSLLC
jgi:hypothetical protein